MTCIARHSHTVSRCVLTYAYHVSRVHTHTMFCGRDDQYCGLCRDVMTSIAYTIHVEWAIVICFELINN